MSTRNDDTKEIKRMIDDETIEQLVENRPTPRKVNTAAAAHKKKKKRKKNYALTALITVLGFFLVFVVFFVGSYIIFSSSPSENDVNTQNVTVPSEDKAATNKKTTVDSDEKTFDSEAVDVKTEKDDAVVSDGDSEKEEEEEKKPEEKPAQDKTEKEDTTPAVKPDKTTQKPAAPEKNDSQEKKPADTAENDKIAQEDKNTTPQKPAVSSGEVVEKNENSEAIILD